jgi:hypothetical protein
MATEGEMSDEDRIFDQGAVGDWKFKSRYQPVAMDHPDIEAAIKKGTQFGTYLDRLLKIGDEMEIESCI